MENYDQNHLLKFEILKEKKRSYLVGSFVTGAINNC